jgi:hypothetical protein
VISQPPVQVSWDLSAEVTIAWEAQGEALDQAADLGTGLAVSELKKNHPKGAAVLACALATGEAADAAADQPDEFAEILETSVGIRRVAASAPPAGTPFGENDSHQRRSSSNARTRSSGSTTDSPGYSRSSSDSGATSASG